MHNTLLNWLTRRPQTTPATRQLMPPPGRVLINDAALIATFYGARKKERLQPLVARLINAFSLTEYKKEGVVVNDNWINEEGPIFLRRFDPSATNDCRATGAQRSRGGGDCLGNHAREVGRNYDDESL